MSSRPPSAIGLIEDETAPLRRITVDQYHRMIAAGIFDEGERVQLIDGLFVVMTPHGPPHAMVLLRLNRLLIRGLGDEYAVLSQLPVTLGADSEPEPDLTVVRAADATSRQRHPTTALLVIEVSRSSLGFDRKVKGALYARSGIPEYWVVDVERESVEVFRDPDPGAGTYQTREIAAVGQALLARSVPELSIDLSDLFR